MSMFRRRPPKVRDTATSKQGDAAFVDESTLVVRLIPDSGVPDDSDVRMYCEWYGLGVHVDEASTEIRSIAWDGEHGAWTPYAYQQRLSRVEWGASGGIAEFFLDVSTSITADMVLLGMGYVIGRLRAAKLDTPDAEGPGGLQAFARRAVVKTYELTDSQVKALQLVESEAHGSVGRFVYTLEDQRFEASVGRLESGEIYVRVTRSSL